MSEELSMLKATEGGADVVAALQAERRAQIKEFVRTNPDYYVDKFDKIGSRSGFTPTFNWLAGLLGPVWFGARGLWNWAVAFLLVEALGFVRIALGLFGDLGAEARERIGSIEGTLALRKQQLASAIENNSDKVDVYQRTVKSLEDAIGGIRADAQLLQEQGTWIALSGLGIVLVAKLIQALVANTALEARFSDWLSDNSITSGMPMRQIVFSAVFVLIIFATAMLHYSFPGSFPFLSEFPTHESIRLTAIQWVEAFFSFAVTNGDALFDFITYGIRLLLDTLELIFVKTPWIVIASFIILLTWLSAGIRTAIYSGAFLAYMGFLGFWEKAMTTLALLGTAACLSIAIGIPLGMFCARRKRFYSFIQPIMDFMQTMPAFVFMIPVIAFFGTGKPAAVVTTMIFGGTPVVRLTVLGLRGVPEHVREAAISFGASKWWWLR